MTNENVIKFYLQNGHYGEFSNFSNHAVYLKDRRWPTSEHYFQAQKFEGTEYEEQIRNAPKPMKAANMGRDRSLPLRLDWEEVKDDIMRETVMAKFTQHKKLKALLLGTVDAELIEHTTNDSYWGDGGDSSGLNRLGEILMEVRQAIKEGKSRHENGNFV
jgi:ribA/ribD-fused uncharacterized protein